MEVGPTLDIADASYDEDEVDGEPEPEPWGRLFPVQKCFIAQDLVKDEYTFGRGENCDHCFEVQSGGAKNTHFLALSKTHFLIYRERGKGGDSVFIQDKSSNGTFINGEKIGKNKKRILNGDDEIALSLKKNKAFIFSDCGNSSSIGPDLPEAFKEKYIMSKFLGKGTCGEVRLAFEKGTCDKFAVKMISKKTFSVGPILGRAALEEVKILKSIQHPCIIAIKDVFDTPHALFIVLELVEGGELFDKVVDSGKFSESTAKLFFYQMLTAIKYLHDRGITHRDMKPENVLLASDKEETLIKVTDFGLSKFVGENSLMQTLCGTPNYLAPEILESAGTTGYSKAVDLWSLGVILYIMLAGYPPFSDEITDFSLKDQITQARYSFPEKFWEGVSGEAIDMIKRLLTLDPKERITVKEALEHAWLQDEEVVRRADQLMETVSMPPPSLLPDHKKINDMIDANITPSKRPPSDRESSPPPKRPARDGDPSPPQNDTPSPNGEQVVPTRQCSTNTLTSLSTES